MSMKILFASLAVSAIALGGCMHKEEKMMKKEAPAPAAEAPAVEAPAAPAPVAEAPAADANPAADACYENGGTIVQWYDADGKGIDACRTSDGSEYDLNDYIALGIGSNSSGS